MREARSSRLCCAVLAVAATTAVGCGQSDEDGSRDPGGSQRPSSADGAPNFVVVTTDDQAIGSLRFMPAVRRGLGAQGMTFTQGFTTTPECCPSRATFLTGQYSHNHGVLSSELPDGGYASLEGKRNVLPAWLQAAGYRTGHIGKYLNGYGIASRGSDPSEVPPGWDSWSAPVNGSHDKRYGYTLNIDGKLRFYGNAPRDYQTDVFARQASGFVRRSAGNKPFFLNVAPTAPHSEDRPASAHRNPRPAPRHHGALEGAALPTPPSFKSRPNGSDPISIVERARRADEQVDIDVLRAAFLGRSESLFAVDEMVGQLVDQLRKTGELRDTYFIFTSDNGFLLGEHGLRGKGVPYEESVRVPLMIRGPEIEAGGSNDSLVANVDLTPTILELAQASPGRKLDGASLVGILRGDEARVRSALLLELLEGRQKFQAVRSKQWMLARFSSGGSHLFDVADDPYELENLSGEPQVEKTETRLEERLRELSECAGASCR